MIQTKDLDAVPALQSVSASCHWQERASLTTATTSELFGRRFAGRWRGEREHTSPVSAPGVHHPDRKPSVCNMPASGRSVCVEGATCVACRGGDRGEIRACVYSTRRRTYYFPQRLRCLCPGPVFPVRVQSTNVLASTRRDASKIASSGSNTVETTICLVSPWG